MAVHNRRHLSLVLNLLLGAACLWLWNIRSADPHTPSPQARPAFRPASKPDAVLQAEPASLPVPDEIPFHWSQIESEDYSIYIANLRDFGCPERLVRDIILADIEHHYEWRKRRLPEELPFWRTERRREQMRREIELHNLSLQEEKLEVIQELLGIEWDWSTQKEHYEGITFDVVLGFLAVDQRKELAHLVESQLFRPYERIKALANGILLDEDRAAVRDRYLSLIKEAERRFGSANLAEGRARLVLMAIDDFDDSLIKGLSMIEPALSGRDLREIMLRISRPNDPFLEMFNRTWTKDTLDQALRSAMAATVEETELVLETLLGQERFLQYQQAKDPAFQEIYQWIGTQGLPPGTVAPVYELRRTAEDFARATLGEAELPPEDQARLLAEMQEDFEQALLQVLGDAAGHSYLDETREWRGKVFTLPP